MSWECVSRYQVCFLGEKLLFWLGPEFASFDKEPYYYELYWPGRMLDGLCGFGVDLSFGWSEVWEEPKDCIDSGEYGWVLSNSIPPFHWRGAEIPDIILDEIVRNKGKMPGGTAKEKEKVFFTAEYK